MQAETIGYFIIEEYSNKPCLIFSKGSEQDGQRGSWEKDGADGTQCTGEKEIVAGLLRRPTAFGRLCVHAAASHLIWNERDLQPWRRIRWSDVMEERDGAYYGFYKGIPKGVVGGRGEEAFFSGGYCGCVLTVSIGPADAILKIKKGNGEKPFPFYCLLFQCPTDLVQKPFVLTDEVDGCGQIERKHTED